MKHQQMSVMKYKPSEIALFRKAWLKKGYELVDITSLCELKMGTSGWCNEFNEPDETIYHIQVWYRDEQVATFNGISSYVIDDSKHVLFQFDIDTPYDSDFILFRKVRID